MGQIVFILWRESVEALLVVGILYAWLSRTPEAQGGKRWLWAGVVLGLLLAGLVKWLSPLGWPASLGIGAVLGVAYLLFEKKRGVI